MRFLLTTDDGIHSEGVHILFKRLTELGEVVMIAPDREQSAVSHSITLHSPLRLKKAGQAKYVIDGTPVDCINLGIHEIMKKKLPDLILSGINAGLNIGEDVFYSGTVAAALEARIHKLNSAAVSLERSINGSEYNFEMAALWTIKIIKRFFIKRKKNRIMNLNVNIPGIESDAVKDIKVTRLGTRQYPGQIKKVRDPFGRFYYWIGGSIPVYKKEKSNDYHALRNNCISVTPIQLDITDIKTYRELINN